MARRIALVFAVACAASDIAQAQHWESFTVSGDLWMKVAQRAAHRLAWAWIALWSACASALDPSLDVSQYGHTTWRNVDGLGPGTPWVIAQGPDGYLWLGTASGVLLFDGVRSVRWQPPAGTALPDDRVRSLLSARDGTVWIGTLRGLASWKDGRLVTHEALAGKYVNALVEDGEGTVWAGGGDGRVAILCALRGQASECHGSDGSLGPAVMALHLGADGALWMAGRQRVWRWKPAPEISYALPSSVGAVRTLTGSPDGGIVVGTQSGLVKILDGRVEPFLPASMAPRLRFNKVLGDRNGALWMAPVEGGLLHFHEGRLDAFTMSDGLSSDQIYALFEDREGNMWVATRDGLDRFRPIAAQTFARAQGIRGRVISVLAARDGSVWTSTSVALYRLQGGNFTEMRSSGGAVLFEDRRGRIWTGTTSELGYFDGVRFVSVHAGGSSYDSIVEDAEGVVWAAQRDRGLLRVPSDGQPEATPWASITPHGAAASLAVDPVEGGLWLGFWSGDLVHLRDGKVRTSIDLGRGMPDRSVNHVRVDGDGTLWVATEAGVRRVKGGRVSRLDTKEGLPCDSVAFTLVDEESTWLYTACGAIQVSNREMAAWAAAADRDAGRPVAVRLLDHWDGIRTDLYRLQAGQLAEARQFMPRMARTPDGRIWLATLDGLSVVDPLRLPFNAIPPQVSVERVVGDGTSFEPRGVLLLPPLLRNLEIQYSGLSLTLPGKVRFRYKLEGRDAEWQDAGDRRRAFYTDLPPGRYRFRVIAANDSGVWNERGDAVDFSIDAAWWQATAFKVACVMAGGLLLAALYRMRIGQVRRRLTLTLEARTNERLRISRDLHDTLLQSFHGLVLRFQTVLQLWPAEEARRLLERSIDQAANAITEGRDAVQGLRASVTETDDLAQSIRALGETLAVESGRKDAEALRVEVQGTVRALHPLLRDEVFRIAAEALRNAFRHAHATRIEFEVRYGERQLRLRVRDDGKGMDAQVLAQGGREGHFGLGVMRERAQVIGGKLTIWSGVGEGTEVELAVPAAQAYSARPATNLVTRISDRLYRS